MTPVKREKKLCNKCGVSFVTNYNYTRHIARCKWIDKKNTCLPGVYPCDHCGSKFTRKDNLKAHTKKVHGEGRNTKHSSACSQPLIFHCGLCDMWFMSEREIKEHRLTHREENNGGGILGFHLQKSAHGGMCALYRYFFPTSIVFAHTALKQICPQLRRFLIHQQNELGQFKFNLIFLVEYVKLSEDAQRIDRTLVVPFRSETAIIGPFSPVRRIVSECLTFINTTTIEFCERGSGWAENEVLHLDVEIVKCEPISGSCSLHKASYSRGKGLSMQPFTPQTEETSCNLMFTDKDCFYLAIARHFVKSDEVSLLKKFIEESNVNLSALTPVKLEDISAFERANTHLDLSINVVYKDETKSVYPVRVSQNYEAKNVIVLLLGHTACKSGEESEVVPELHYAYLENPDELLAPRKRHGDGVVRKIPAYFCYNCFNYQLRKSSYELHVKWCHEETGQRVIIPSRGETVSFKSDKRMDKIPYMIFFDFETLNKKPQKQCPCPTISEEDLENEAMDLFLELQNGQTYKPKSEAVCHHKTKTLFEQHAFAYGLVMIDRAGVVVEEMVYAGEDADVHFVHTLLDLETKYVTYLEGGGKPLNMTKSDKDAAVVAAVDCELCGNELGIDRIVHHDHITGDFIAVVHNACNLAAKEDKKIVAMAHNFSGYDSHIVAKALGKGFFVSNEEGGGEEEEDCPLEISPQMHYSSFPEAVNSPTKKQLNARQEKQEQKKRSACEKKGKRVLKHLSAIPLNTEKFKTLEINNILLMDSAAFLPDSLDRLTQTLVQSNHTFPFMQERWTSSNSLELLKRKGCYPYSYATSIDRLEKTNTLPPISDFHNIIGDVNCEKEDYTHACNVWDHFKCEDMLEYTKLYVLCDTYLLAEIIWNLRNQVYKEFKLDICHYWSLPMLSKDAMLKFTNVELDLLHDQEMIHVIRKNIRGGLSFVNTRQAEAVQSSDSSKRAIVYLDKNNLYGMAQSFALPHSEFEWMNEEELKAFDVTKDVTNEDGIGYILEVTLRYPERLHKEHNSFPLAPHTMTCEGDKLSDYATKCLDELKPSGKNRRSYKATKLTATFHDRVEYLCHGINLKLYVELGLELVTIHRGIKFHQTAFLRPYIDLCTRKRAASKTKSESDYYKLQCNASYGKTIESIDKRMDCRFNRTDKKAARNFNDPLFKGFLIFGEDLSVTFHRKKEVRLTQNWIVGFSILELSKYIMQYMYYKCVRPALDNRCSVLMSDTDSLLIIAEASSSEEVVLKLESVMDFSNYPIDHPLYNSTRKNKLGYIKNEVPGSEIIAFVGLKSKTYAFKTRDKLHSRAKGVKKIYKESIPFQRYLDCVKNIRSESVTQVSIQSKKHQNILVSGDRVAFNSFDDKRYLMCSIHSVPYGSYYIQKMKEEGGKCYFCKHPGLLI